jgi:hypothetical protein
MSLSVAMLPTWAATHQDANGGPPGVAELFAATERVLATMAPAPTSVILSTGSEPLVEDVTTLALDDRSIAVAGAPELVGAIVERGQVPRVQAAALGGRAAALAATIHAARPNARFVGVAIPGLADPAAIAGASAALRGALWVAADVVLVLPGDFPADDAHALGRLRSALADHDLGALADLATQHPGLAEALAPVRLALDIARARSERFRLDAELLLGNTLYAVGSAA